MFFAHSEQSLNLYNILFHLLLILELCTLYFWFLIYHQGKRQTNESENNDWHITTSWEFWPVPNLFNFMSCNSNIFLPKTNHASTTKYFWYNKIPIYKIDFIFIKILIKGSAQDLWNQAKKTGNQLLGEQYLKASMCGGSIAIVLFPLTTNDQLPSATPQKKKKAWALFTNITKNFELLLPLCYNATTYSFH